jgi:hypothetical protein
MTLHRREFLVFALVCASGVPAHAQADVVGIWSAQVRTKGGLGAQMTFTADGKVTSTFGALVDFNYEIDGSKLKLSQLNPKEPAPPPFSQEFSVEGNKLSINQPGKDPDVMSRVGMPIPGVHPIVGDWRYVASNSMHGLVRYSRAGVMQYSLPFQTHSGTYRAQGHELHIAFENQPPLALTSKREGDVLTTTDPKGKQIVFVKFTH